MIPTLSAQDLERPRTQPQFQEWLEAKHREFGKTKNGRRAIRLRRGHLVKEFVEELWPLNLFAQWFYAGRTDVQFRPAIGNQSYDARILDSASHRTIQFLQITQAFDAAAGFQNHLRMLHLEAYGHAPMTGRPLLVKNPETGQVDDTWGECIAPDEARAEVFGLIRKAVERKTAMRYEENTALIVEYDDAFVDSSEAKDALRAFIRAHVVQSASNFSELYVVGSGGTFGYRFEAGGRPRH